MIDQLLGAHRLVGRGLVGGCSRVLCCGGSRVKLCLVWCLKEFHSHYSSFYLMLSHPSCLFEESDTNTSPSYNWD